MSQVTEHDDGFDLAPRIVKPRTRKYRFHPVIALSGTQALDEEGQIHPVDDVVRTLPDREPTLFARLNAADFIASIDKPLARKYPKTWQRRASVHERDIIRHDGVRIASRSTIAIHFFGFKGGNQHKIIDPVVMYGHRLETIWPHESDRLVALLQWATTLRNFCHENGMDVRPTIGSLSAQFLTDARFYSQPRRKVPAKINERTREDATVGNHYVLNTYPTPKHEFTALYLDQHKAHHYHAATVPLPDSNYLFAHGYFKTLERIAFRKTWDDFCGLYCLSLTAPTLRPHTASIVRRSQWVRSLDRAFVYSNELPHLYDLGYKVDGVYAAWGSHCRDIGLARYARWAQEQLDYYGNQKWIKPLLLSTYGVLATRPKQNSSIFRLANRGEIVSLCTGKHELTGKLVTQPRKLEPNIANVLHRGMIEAATRSESVGYSQYLASLGWSILAIYADAVIVRNDDEQGTPPLFDPWRCKTELNHLQFINQQAFVSGEMTKLPGISRELRDYRQHTMPGHAPRVTQYEAITNQRIRTDRRI